MLGPAGNTLPFFRSGNQITWSRSGVIFPELRLTLDNGRDRLRLWALSKDYVYNTLRDYDSGNGKSAQELNEIKFRNPVESGKIFYLRTDGDVIDVVSDNGSVKCFIDAKVFADSIMKHSSVMDRSTCSRCVSNTVTCISLFLCLVFLAGIALGISYLLIFAIVTTINA